MAWDDHGQWVVTHRLTCSTRCTWPAGGTCELCVGACPSMGDATRRSPARPVKGGAGRMSDIGEIHVVSFEETNDPAREVVEEMRGSTSFLGWMRVKIAPPGSNHPVCILRQQKRTCLRLEHSVARDWWTGQRRHRASMPPSSRSTVIARWSLGASAGIECIFCHRSGICAASTTTARSTAAFPLARMKSSLPGTNA